MKILIVVPAFNEGQSIAAVIKDLRRTGYRNILVVDDGSSDETGEIANKVGVTVLRHELNRGLGAALGTGFGYCHNIKADILVTFDADSQHKATDIARLIDPIERGEADVVIGSRLLDARGMPLDRRIINWVANVITYVFYGVLTTDSQSGLRAFSRKAIEKIEIKTDRMEVSSEFFKEIKKNHLRFQEIPIKPIYTEYSRRGGQSNLNSLAVTFKMVLRLFR